VEGSHAQDNQVSSKTAAYLQRFYCEWVWNFSKINNNLASRARQYDLNTARVLKLSIESGVLENGNNSLQAQFAASSRRHARARVRQVESVELDGGKQLKAKLKAATQCEKAQELEIQQLRSRINAQPQLEASSHRCMSTRLFV
jgi:hypothetical protein